LVSLLGFPNPRDNFPPGKALLATADEHRSQYPVLGTIVEEPGADEVEVRGFPQISRDRLISIARNFSSDLPEESREGPTPFRKGEHCRAVAIPEPAKVRVITAMPPFPQWVARPVQRSLARFLHRIPIFRLTGEQVNEDIVSQFLTRTRDNSTSILGPMSSLMTSDDLFWVSGDYSAATDGLDIRATRVALDVILSHLTPEDREVYGPALEDSVLLQTIVYGPNSAFPTIEQKNGQLMGSVLSFPILCILNLYTYFLALPPSTQSRLLRRQRGATDELHSLPVLVNGDDILFLSDKEHYSRWTESVGKVGFTLSQGKNFTHRRFAVVNSFPMDFDAMGKGTRFLFRRDLAPWSRKRLRGWSDDQSEGSDDEDRALPSFDRPGPEVDVHDHFERPYYTFRLLSYFNVGLLTGMSKLTARLGEQDLTLPDWYGKSVCSSFRADVWHYLFLWYHRHTLRRAAYLQGFPLLPNKEMELNLFASTQLGGLGFPIPRAPNFANQVVHASVTWEQRLLAGLLYEEAAASAHLVLPDRDLNRLLPTVVSYRQTESKDPYAYRSLITRYGSITPRIGPRQIFLTDEPMPDPVIPMDPITYMHSPSEPILTVNTVLPGRFRREMIRRLASPDRGESKLMDALDLFSTPFVLNWHEAPRPMELPRVTLRDDGETDSDAGDDPFDHLASSVGLQSSELEDWEISSLTLQVKPPPPDPLPPAVVNDDAPGELAYPPRAPPGHASGTPRPRRRPLNQREQAEADRLALLADVYY
jgi:hypothetical protein